MIDFLCPQCDKKAMQMRMGPAPFRGTLFCNECGYESDFKEVSKYIQDKRKLKEEEKTKDV